MLFLLIRYMQPWLDAHELGFLRVFTFVTFQATVSVLISFLIVLCMGPSVIRWLRAQKIGDLAKFDEAGMDELMKDKVNTPTMGGILIIFAIAFTTLLLADLQNFYVQMALVCLIWLGAVGAADDWLKLTSKRREEITGKPVRREGLTELEKLLFQVGLGIVLSYFTYNYGRELSPNTSFYVPFFKNVAIPLAPWVFVMIGTLMVTFQSNAVNLTDGLDGLATGCAAIVSVSLLLLALIIGAMVPYNHPTLNQLLLPFIKGSDQMAVLAGAMTGACLGFLWWNCNPAKVFMGDTGSLALGGLMGYIAIVIRQEILLFMIGGVFVVEIFSSFIQRYYFKYTRIRFGQGKRIFLMAPIHHHFQKKGWTETQVVTRFWLIGAMLAAMGLATLKLR